MRRSLRAYERTTSERENGVREKVCSTNVRKQRRRRRTYYTYTVVSYLSNDAGRKSLLPLARCPRSYESASSRSAHAVRGKSVALLSLRHIPSHYCFQSLHTSLNNSLKSLSLKRSKK